MLLRGKPAKDWTREDALGLVGVAEQGRTVEFKRELHLDTPEQRREFLCDVTSFANAAGGHILYGVAEEDGVASSVAGIGLKATDVDALLQRIENLVRDGVEPRLRGLGLYPVELGEVSYVLIVEIPKSWTAPHAVTGSGNSLRFYTRNSVGKQPLDVGELRSAFLLSDSLAQRIRSFHIERLVRIQAGETPVPLPDTPKAVMHIIPLMSFEPGASVPMEEGLRAMRVLGFPEGGALTTRPNLDGVLGYRLVEQQDGVLAALRYRQLFRTGVVEAVHTQLGFVSPRHGKIIQPDPTADWFFHSCTMALSLLERLGQQPPLVVEASLLGFGGYVLPRPEEFASPIRSYPVDRDAVDLPEILLDEYLPALPLLDALRPVLDTLWNASGHLNWPGYEARRRGLERAG